MQLLNRIAVTLAGLSLLLMTALGAADVAGTGFGVPIAGVYEVVETLMVLTIFLSVAAAQQQRAHINVELVKKQLGPRTQAVLVLFGLVCSGGFFVLIAYFGWFATMRSFGSGEIRQGQIGFLVWPARMALAVGASLMVAQCLVQFMFLLRELLAGRVTLKTMAQMSDTSHI